MMTWLWILMMVVSSQTTPADLTGAGAQVPAQAQAKAQARAEVGEPVSPERDVSGQATVSQSVSPENVLTSFLEHVQDCQAYSTDAKAFVAMKGAEWNEDKRAVPQDVINESLSVLSDDFRRGLKQLASDESALAAVTLEGISLSGDPYLAVAGANLAASVMIELGQFERCLTMLDAVRVKHQPVERYTLAADYFYFTLGLCQFQNLEYDAAQATLTSFMDRFPDAAEELRGAARRILDRLSKRVPGQLDDVQEMLSLAARKMQNNESAEAIVQRQQEATDLLDVIIQKIEFEEKRKAKGKCDGAKKKAECKKKQACKKTADSPKKPANESKLMGGESQESELSQAAATPGEAWGNMPARDREEVLQALQKQFPSRYRELLEQYYKQLAKDGE